MKKEIVERLLKAKHINFDEALELMDKDTMLQPYIAPQHPQPYIAPQHPHPYIYPNWPYPNIICSGQSPLNIAHGNHYQPNSPFTYTNQHERL